MYKSSSSSSPRNHQSRCYKDKSWSADRILPQTITDHFGHLPPGESICCVHILFNHSKIFCINSEFFWWPYFFWGDPTLMVYSNFSNMVQIDSHCKQIEKKTISYFLFLENLPKNITDIKDNLLKDLIEILVSEKISQRIEPSVFIFFFFCWFC